MLVLLLALVSCEEKPYYEEAKMLNGSWPEKQTANFQFRPDESGDSQINIIFRHNDDYKYSNIRFFASLYENKKLMRTDTLHFILADPDGKWRGSGLSKTKEIYLNYIPAIKLTAGTPYTIKIQQAMRDSKLFGAEDIGLSVIRVKK